MGNLIFGDSSNPAEVLNSVFSSNEDPQKAAIEWARNLLQEKNIDPVKSPSTAIKEIRTKEPALGLKTATYLVNEVR